MAWDDAAYGGTVSGGLKRISNVFSAEQAFAALKKDGTEVAWGDTATGGAALLG